MSFNIYRVLRGCGVAAGLSAIGPTAVGAQTCGPESGALSAAGWDAYRAGMLSEAEARFVAAGRACPGNRDAANGQGYVALRRGELRVADSIFSAVLRIDSASSDAWTGMALVSQRSRDTSRMRVAALRAVRIDSANATARQLLDAVDPDWNRANRAATRPDSLQLHSRTRAERFEVRPSGSAEWRRIWIKGVNLGVALPGRFPSEFPQDSALYGGWIDTIAAMNANTIRVYTILPPAFYRALAAWNSTRPAQAIWLVQGVWAELPPENDFDDAGWRSALYGEMRRAVDVVHGAAVLPARRGHASGRYDADVSRWTLAWIVGREWEPYAVKAFAATHPGRRLYRGRFLRGDSLPAPDHWMTEACDSLLGYEFDRYHALRPIAYTNWPTLDPLVHPTEATAAEERAWRRKAGRDADVPVLEYENDAVSLDASLVHPTSANVAGWFASYHAYPYYPDFMNLDPGYGRARSSEGPSSYFGYVRALREHHRGIPLLIAEYGVPSSRGNAHLQRDGWHHGGHDEQAMAAIDARLTRELHEAGAAGGIVFAWLDEWFKRNWLVLDFELPAESTRRWHNVMDPEQNYGILSMRAGRKETRPVPGGPPGSWLRDGETLTISADASFVYLGIRTATPFSWATHGIEIGVDTHLREVGQHLLPRSGLRSGTGFEFVVDLPHPDSGSIRILPEYNRHGVPGAQGDDGGRFLRRPITIRDRHDGRFDRMLVTTNRARFGRDGRFFPSTSVDRGALRFGRETESSLADWFHDSAAGVIQVRIPWDLLNVGDPSSRTLILDQSADGPIGTTPANDFHFEAIVYERDGRAEPQVLRSGPWRWTGWTDPVWHTRLKPVYQALRDTWSTIR